MPLLYACLLFARPPSLEEATRFLTRDYAPHAFWWELVEAGKKLLLTGWLALVLPGSFTQMFLGVVASLALLVLQLQVRPFRHAADGLLATVKDVCLTFSMLGTLGLDTSFRSSMPAGGAGPGAAADGAFAVGRQQADVIVDLLVLAALLVIVAAAVLVSSEIRAARAAPFARWASDGAVVEPRLLDESRRTRAPARFHSFISHVWGSGQDQARVIKAQLQLLVPHFAAFLDVDDLEETSALEAYVDASDTVRWGVLRLGCVRGGCAAAHAVRDALYRRARESPPTPDPSPRPPARACHGAPHWSTSSRARRPNTAVRAPPLSSSQVIIFLSGSLAGSGQRSDYFGSKAAMREFRHAVATEKRCVRVLETDPRHGGVALPTHREACPADLRAAFEAMPLVPWHRVRAFQLVALRLILRAILSERPSDSITFLQAPVVLPPCRVYCSAHNVDAAAVAESLVQAAGDGLLTVASDTPEGSDVFLLVLNGHTDATGMLGNAGLHAELNGVLRADGGAWQCVGRAKPQGGKEMHNATLAQALTARRHLTQRSTIHFSESEWQALAISSLRIDHCIKGRDGQYYQPMARPGVPRVVLVHEQREGFGAVPFEFFLGCGGLRDEPVTPPALLELGLYEQIAVPFYEGDFGVASVRLLLLRLRSVKVDGAASLSHSRSVSSLRRIMLAQVTSKLLWASQKLGSSGGAAKWGSRRSMRKRRSALMDDFGTLELEVQ